MIGFPKLGSLHTCPRVHRVDPIGTQEYRLSVIRRFILSGFQVKNGVGIDQINRAIFAFDR